MRALYIERKEISMRGSFDENDNLPKSLPDEAPENDEIDYEEYTDQKEGSYQEEVEYYDLPASPKERSMGWSLLSLALSVLSVALCAFWYVSFPLAVGAVVFAVISRRKLGYFDKMSVFGLIVGIVGFVFSAFSLFVSISGVLDGLIN